MGGKKGSVWHGKTMKQRFHEKYNVNSETNCWEWAGHLSDKGYGYFRIANKMEKAHRASYTINVGEILNGLHVCHKCDNPKCVNPDHLFLGTHMHNMQDMIEKGRDTKYQNPHPSRFYYEKKGCRCNGCVSVMKSFYKKHNDKKKVKQQLVVEAAAAVVGVDFVEPVVVVVA